MVPVTTELFVEAENGQKYVLCRKFKCKQQLATSFSWIRPQLTTFQLLTDKRYSFPSAWIVDKPMNQIFHVPLNQLLTKGLYVEHNVVDQTVKQKTRNSEPVRVLQKYTMPMGNFDHD